MSRSLRELLAAEGALAPEQAVRLLELLLVALSELHAREEVHGALHPGTVRLEARGLRLEPGEADPRYAAPELDQGYRPAMASDVYAAGMLGWTLALGRAPTPLEPPPTGWYGELVLRLTEGELERRPLNGAAALDTLRSLRPSGTQRTQVLQRGGPSPAGKGASRQALMAMGGLLVLLAGGLAALALWPDGDPEAEGEGSAELDPLPPEPAGCSDDKAEGVFAEAGQAWASCRFVQAVDLYEANAEAELRPAVAACRAERVAAASPHREALQRVEADLDAGACHWARTKLGNIAGWSTPQACAGALDACEAQELPLRRAEVGASELRLDAQLRSPVVRDVAFRSLPGDDWTWDIVVEGGWVEFFDTLERLTQSGTPTDTATAMGMIGYFTLVCDAVGRESQATMWNSRHLVFEDGPACVTRLQTSRVREVSRRLKKAREDADQDAFVAAVQYMYQRMEPC